MKTRNPYNPWRVNIALSYGRDNLTRSLLNDISAGRSCALCGGRRIGKTTLLRVVERAIRAELLSSIAEGRLTLPIYIDLTSLDLRIGPRQIYETIYDQMIQLLRVASLLPDDWDFQHIDFSQAEGDENHVFRDLYAKVLNAIESVCFVQTVILFDEIEPLVQSKWGDIFLANWRSILNNDPDVSRNICAIFAGAKEMKALYKDLGSPIGNILTWRTIDLLGWKDTKRLLCEPIGQTLHASLMRMIYVQTGGHPFLIQYLMHHLVESGDYTPARLGVIAKEFLDHHSQQFENWSSRLSSSDRFVFGLLSTYKGWASKRRLIQAVGDSAANDAVSALAQTGVLRTNPRRPFRYRTAGTLFTNWFRWNILPNIKATEKPFSKWVITLHGIRTRGIWQKQLNESLNQAGLSHAPFDYGFFGALRLVFPPARERVLARFLKEYTDHVARNGNRPSIIGHSFGAYLICKAMEKYSDIEFDQIILCGSIVDSTFNWSDKIPRQASRVLNDFGSRDLWARVAGWLIVDAGESGTKGFEDTANGAVLQRSHGAFRHSDYFYRLNYENTWVPFLRGLNPNQVAAQSHTKANKRFLVTAVILSLTTLFLIILFLRSC